MQIIKLNNRLSAQFIAVLSALFLVYHYKEHYEDYYLEKHEDARNLLAEKGDQPPAKGGEKAAKGEKEKRQEGDDAAAAAARAARAADGVGAHDEKKFPRWRGVSGCAVCRASDHRTAKCDQAKVHDWIVEKCTSNTGRRRAVGLFGRAKVEKVLSLERAKRQQGDDGDNQDCGSIPELVQEEDYEDVKTSIAANLGPIMQIVKKQQTEQKVDDQMVRRQISNLARKIVDKRPQQIRVKIVNYGIRDVHLDGQSVGTLNLQEIHLLDIFEVVEEVVGELYQLRSYEMNNYYEIVQKAPALSSGQ